MTWLINILNLEMIHPALKDVLRDLETEYDCFTITSLYRIENGVHHTMPLRAIDLRCRNIEVGRSIEYWVNKRWAYDPTRPGYEVCMFHDTGRGKHLHVQVHDLTVRQE